MTRLLRAILFSSIFALPIASIAAPPIWDADFGADTGLVADDEFIDMTLGFMFPYDGTDYDTISINSNGGVTLGLAGVFAGDQYVDYDLWEISYFVSDFSNVGNPIIVPFNTDLDKRIRS